MTKVGLTRHAGQQTHVRHSALPVPLWGACGGETGRLYQMADQAQRCYEMPLPRSTSPGGPPSPRLWLVFTLQASAQIKVSPSVSSFLSLYMPRRNTKARSGRATWLNERLPGLSNGASLTNCGTEMHGELEIPLRGWLCVDTKKEQVA